jgi:drug/metabolite transporter (DMT)-like permease
MDPMLKMTRATGRTDYRQGTLYAITTAVLMAVQAPLSTLAARTLSPLDFMAITQFALLFSIPFLIMRADSRRDFIAIVLGVRDWPKLAVIFLVGVTGLGLYDVGLSSAHPIITAAVLNLTPFWAALIAFIVSRRKISIPPFAFFGCFLLAFCGAMVIAWSQIDVDSKVLARDVMQSFMHSRWIYALPAPAFFALSGTLVFKWFSDFDEPAAIAANFAVSSLVLIPIAVVASDFGGQTDVSGPSVVAILLLLLGTLAASGAGRVFYQMALTATENDNGYVTMFFLLMPPLSALITLPLSRWIPDLQFNFQPMFFVGAALVTVPLLLLSLTSWRDSQLRGSVFGAKIQEDDIEPAPADARNCGFSGDRLPKEHSDA